MDDTKLKLWSSDVGGFLDGNIKSKKIAPLANAVSLKTIEAASREYLKGI